MPASTFKSVIKSMKWSKNFDNMPHRVGGFFTGESYYVTLPTRV